MSKYKPTRSLPKGPRMENKRQELPRACATDACTSGGSSRFSPYQNSQASPKGKKRTYPCIRSIGGPDAEIVTPSSRVMLSTNPQKLTRVRESEITNTCKRMRSSKSLLSKSVVSDSEIWLTAHLLVRDSDVTVMQVSGGNAFAPLVRDGDKTD